MTALSSQNLDVITAEVAYRHRTGQGQSRPVRGTRWLRLHRRDAERAA